jgi:hypothetical protein
MLVRGKKGHGILCSMHCMCRSRQDRGSQDSQDRGRQRIKTGERQACLGTAAQAPSRQGIPGTQN